MKQALQLKLGQQLTLTPQLQQAIKLLQLSTLDLQQTISETLESNPLLDEEELVAEPVDDDIRESVDFSDSVSDAMPGTELQVDAAWEDVMPSAAPPSSGMSAGSDDLAFAERDSLPETLQSHLLWQLNLTRFSATDHAIALAFIDAVDSEGRLTQTPEQIHTGLALDDVEIDEVMAVLHRLQHFELKVLQPVQDCHDLIYFDIIQCQSSMNLFRGLGQSAFTVDGVDESEGNSVVSRREACQVQLPQ